MNRLGVAGALLAACVLQAPGLTAAPQQAAGTGGATPVSATTPSIQGHTDLLLDPGFAEELDALVAEAMREWSVPGLALAVVVGDNVIVSKGYGHRHRESALPVTEATLFPVSSLTKPVTATLLSSLVDDGVLDWDRPVIEYLPDFRLRDAAATTEVTLRDLVTHQSGLPRHDFVWYGTNLKMGDLYERLKFLEPSTSVRGGWQYQNLMFMVAGYVAERATGSAWQQLMRERIFEPLDMDTATFSLNNLKECANIAFPYADGPEGARRVPFRSVDALGPAGSINASVAELSRFLRALLGAGAFEGRRVVSADAVREMLEPQVELPQAALGADFGAGSYGLGLVLGEYAGKRLAHHEGGVDGFVSLLSFLPDNDVGVVVLTNYSGDNPVPWVVTRSIYDALLGRERSDWIAHARTNAELRSPAARRARVTAGPVGSWRQHGYRPSPADFAGTYRHPAYGRVDVVLAGNELRMVFHGIEARLEPDGDYRYRVDAGVLAGLHLSFSGNALNRIERVAIPWEPEVDDIVFVRQVGADGDEDKGKR